MESQKQFSLIKKTPNEWGIQFDPKRINYSSKENSQLFTSLDQQRKKKKIVPI